MITEIEQQTLDIDWFFVQGNSVGFVVSGGGKLPNFISHSPEINKQLVSYFRTLPVISDIVLNPTLNSIIPNITNEYLVDFLDMSRRGLFSFDKTVLNDFQNSCYHLVSKPTLPLKFDTLPTHVKELLNICRIDFEVDMYLNIDDINLSKDNNGHYI